jgi:peptidoglycan/LPS O-acetylase OafA/YrhL
MVKNLKREYSVDLIRGLAIILIVFFHFFYAFHPDNGLRYIGFIGVSLFFIASGFMLAKKYPQVTTFSFRWFFKRFFKIASLYYLAIVVIVLLFEHQSYSGGLWKNLVLHFLFLDPLFPQYAYGIISPAWFLTPLIALYLVYPYLNRLVKNYSFLIVLFFLIMIFIRFRTHSLVDYNPLFFIGEFCFGIGLAYSRRLWPILSSLLVLFVNWVMIVPFIVFLLIYKMNINDAFGKMLVFISVNSFALFLFHEAYLNLITSKWRIYSLNFYPALIVLSLSCIISVFVSNWLQKKILSKV